MQCFPFRLKMGRPTEGPPAMTQRRARSILRRWSSYDNDTIAKAQQIMRATGWPYATSLSQVTIYSLAIMFAALFGLLGIAQFLGTGM